jgi:hypothetical protein
MQAPPRQGFGPLRCFASAIGRRSQCGRNLDVQIGIEKDCLVSNDHFVPKFYLRNFSSNCNGPVSRGREAGSIKLIHLSTGAYVRNASIKGQCQKPNFYGFAEGLEAEFGKLETQAAEIIRKIIANQTLPPIGTFDRSALTAFVVLQRSRTEAAASDMERLGRRLASAIYEGDVPSKDADNWADPPLKLVISTAVEAIPFAEQLAMHLFINQSAEEFITSDHPAVAHNMYCQGINHKGVLGWNCSGVQIFLPLSPMHLLMLYDGQTYALGRNKSRYLSILQNKDDVRAFNSLQILSGRQAVYFKSDSMAQVVAGQLQRLIHLRNRKRLVTVMTGSGEGSSDAGELIHQYERLFPIHIELSAIRLRRSRARISLRQRADISRQGTQRLQDVRDKSLVGGVRFPVRQIFED